MYKIAYVTSSRADYGIVRNYLNLLKQDQEIELRVIVTGAMLDERFARQVSLIREDNLIIDGEITTRIDTTSNKAIINNMAETLSKFGEFFESNKYDLLILLGDRYEILSVAIAAAIQRIPILHIHGGELTYGNYDEFIRHSITKMSLYHFTATEEYRRRVIQLGEYPKNVFNLGALGAENCLNIDIKNVPQMVLDIPKKKYFVILFHPETLTNNVLEQVTELLGAVDEFNNYRFVFLGTNADTKSDIIRNKINDYINRHPNTYYFENIHTDAYHYLLKNGICLIGNSSSGIIEAPSLGIPTINIGKRQSGRVRGNSVIDVECNKSAIINAINKILKDDEKKVFKNPYYKPNSTKLYYEKTKEILNRIRIGIDVSKKFYDINF